MEELRMTKTIENIRWLEIIPPAIRNDPQIQAMDAALTPQLQEVSQAIQDCIILARLDELSEPIVDLLAWQYHVDFYEINLGIEQKRNLVRNSIDVHRHKGTPYAIEQVVEAVYGNCNLKEWFEYGGEPYFFRIDVTLTEECVDKTKAKRVLKAIESVKNTRSWLEKLAFYYPDIYLGIQIKYQAHIQQKIMAHHCIWNLGSVRSTYFDGEFMEDGTIRYNGFYPNGLYREQQVHQVDVKLSIMAQLNGIATERNDFSGGFCFDGSHCFDGPKRSRNMLIHHATIMNKKEGSVQQL